GRGSTQLARQISGYRPRSVTERSHAISFCAAIGIAAASGELHAACTKTIKPHCGMLRQCSLAMVYSLMHGTHSTQTSAQFVCGPPQIVRNHSSTESKLVLWPFRNS